MTTPAIDIHNLTKTYPNFSLGPINLTIPQGTIVGYIGENGAGKSTTIKALLGLIRPDTGHISILGQAQASRDPALKNRIGVVFDDLPLPQEMIVQDVDTLCRLTFDTWEPDTFANYIRDFHLPLKATIKSLSRGMTRKLSLAIALSHQADLLLLDEATAGLDPVARDDILDILLDFIQDETHTVLISSHILSDLEKVADYIAFIHKGQILFMDEKDRLQETYALCSVDQATYEAIDPQAIVGIRSHAFGHDLLVLRDAMPNGINLTKPSIDDIMVYILKGDAQ